MTYDVKLDQIFNTVDPFALRQSIVDNYMVRRGVTALIDNLNRTSIVIFDAVNKEWRDGNRVINTNSKKTILPFSVAKTRHDFAMKCSCSADYAARFNVVVDSIVDAYTLTMIPILKQQQIDQLETDLIPLEKQQQDALTAVQEATETSIDDQLERLKKELLDKDQEIVDLYQTIQDLTAFQSQIQQSHKFSNIMNLLKNNIEKTRLSLVAKVTQQNVYANELKTDADIKATLVVANALMDNLTLDKSNLDQRIATREQQNTLTQEARELTALRHLSGIAKQIADIRAELDRLNQ